MGEIASYFSGLTEEDLRGPDVKSYLSNLQVMGIVTKIRSWEGKGTSTPIEFPLVDLFY